MVVIQMKTGECQDSSFLDSDYPWLQSWPFYSTGQRDVRREGQSTGQDILG